MENMNSLLVLRCNSQLNVNSLKPGVTGLLRAEGIDISRHLFSPVQSRVNSASLGCSGTNLSKERTGPGLVTGC